MGEAGMGMVSISERVRCFRIGFFTGPETTGRSIGWSIPTPSIPSRSAVVASRGGRTGSTWAVCNGPYSHVTSESLSLMSQHKQHLLVVAIYALPSEFAIVPCSPLFRAPQYWV
jgi:hypothetical protein